TRRSAAVRRFAAWARRAEGATVDARAGMALARIDRGLRDVKGEPSRVLKNSILRASPRGTRRRARCAPLFVRAFRTSAVHRSARAWLLSLAGCLSKHPARRASRESARAPEDPAGAQEQGRRDGPGVGRAERLHAALLEDQC